VIIIPQNDLKAGYLAQKGNIDAAVQSVLASGWFILGKEVEAFEREWAAFIGVRHAVGVANGTDALVLALKALGVGPGDSVATVSHTAVATVAAIELAGAKPVFVDIDPADFTMAPDSLQEVLGKVVPTPKAVIVVHLYGQSADLKAILQIANRFGARVIEDCAQSHGALLDGQRTGTFGELAAFSFYPTKNLGALGDGGAVVTNDSSLDQRLRMLREYGWKERYVSLIPGMNSRLDEMQAAILRARLSFLEKGNRRRREIAAMYSTGFSRHSIEVPYERPDTHHVFHQYVIRIDRRDIVRDRLKQKGVGTLIHYPLPVHLQPAYRQRFSGQIPLPNTEAVVGRILSLPMYPELSDGQIERVIAEVISGVAER